MNTHFFKTIVRLLLCVMSFYAWQLYAPASKTDTVSDQFGTSLRELYDLVLDATEEQLLSATSRTEKYHKIGNYLAQDIKKQAEQSYNKIEEEQQKLVTELAQAQEQIEVLKARELEVKKDSSEELKQLRAVNKFLSARVTKLENDFQNYLQGLINQVNNLQPAAAAGEE